MQPILTPPVTFNVDDGGGGGPAQGTPTAAVEAANARIDREVAAGLRDDGDDANGRVTDPTAGVPTAAGAPADPAAPPAAPAAEDPNADPLAGIDFDHLSYRDGVKLREQLTASKQRYAPFEQAFKGLEDTDRQAAVESLTRLGDQAAPVLGLVSGMHPNDRAVVLSAYTDFLEDPAKGAAAFRAIADSIAPAGVDPSATGAPAPAGAAPEAGASDDDAPLTKGEWARMQAEQQAQAAEQQALVDAERGVIQQATELGYSPDSTDEAEVDRFRELMFLTANRTAGDVKKANDLLTARRQAVIDGYLSDKKANAQRPAAPETGTASSGQTDGNNIPPMEKARARIEAEMGPDKFARQ